MPCMCGDTYCPSCGTAQGNSKCPACGRWAEDGCVAPDACDAAIAAAEDAYATQVAEEDALARQYWSDEEDAGRFSGRARTVEKLRAIAEQTPPATRDAAVPFSAYETDPLRRKT